MNIQLNVSPSDKKRIEAFIRLLDEQLTQHPYDWKSLKESGRIVDAAKFSNHDNSLTITIIYVEAYQDANIIAKANSLNESMQWGQNGSIMYVVESPDNDKVDKVVGIFAGRE